MLVINEDDIKTVGIEWDRTISVIGDAVDCLVNDDFSQPVKPYLRYRNRRNRIIAMPAFVGGDINLAGIKWIASFPDNIRKGKPRAHSVVILNDADTGEPLATICTALLSTIRTASVSGFVLKYFARTREIDGITLGIIGFGPIGQYHLKMCLSLLGDRIKKILLYDIMDIDPSLIRWNEDIKVVKRWEDAYLNADIFITCTVSDAPYIDKRPKAGSLHLNVSLRDFKTDVYEWFKNTMIVDDWEEVCRERTDIEMMHLEKGLQKENTKSIIDIVREDCIGKFDPVYPVMFNPMGMAVFDIAIAGFYYESILTAKM